MGVKSLTLLLVLISSVSLCLGNDGSRCPGTNCTPAPDQSCSATYDREDGCCPVWHCANGQTAYGKSSSSSSSFGSSSSSSWSSGSGGGMPMMGMPGFNINMPFFGRR